MFKMLVNVIYIFILYYDLILKIIKQRNYVLINKDF